MGFLDKLKEGADQAKGLANQAVDRARDEAKELNLKRQIAGAEGELGRAAFELVDEGAVSHPSLEEPAERIRTLRAELAALQEGRGTGQDGTGGETETQAGAEEAATPEGGRAETPAPGGPSATPESPPS
jgi:hypothetical protein